MPRCCWIQILLPFPSLQVPGGHTKLWLLTPQYYHNKLLNLILTCFLINMWLTSISAVRKHKTTTLLNKNWLTDVESGNTSPGSLWKQLYHFSWSTFSRREWYLRHIHHVFLGVENMTFICITSLSFRIKKYNKSKMLQKYP